MFPVEVGDFCGFDVLLVAFVGLCWIVGCENLASLVVVVGGA